MLLYIFLLEANPFYAIYSDQEQILTAIPLHIFFHLEFSNIIKEQELLFRDNNSKTISSVWHVSGSSAQSVYVEQRTVVRRFLVTCFSTEKFPRISISLIQIC